MEFKRAIREELFSIHAELVKRKELTAQKAIIAHTAAANRIKSSIRETDRRFRKLAEDLDAGDRSGVVSFPSVRYAELLLDRRLTKKERLLENS